MSETYDLVVEEDSNGQRLDIFLCQTLQTLSRTRCQALIAGGVVLIEGNPVVKARTPVVTGTTIHVTIPPPRPARPKAQAIALDIVFEDNCLLVLEKPPGLVCHPSPGHEEGTLVNALLYHCGDSLSGIGGEIRPGIVHRLDKDTSGLLVVAKTDQAHHHLAAQFADHGRSGDLIRAYTAFCWGVPSPKRGVISTWLDRSPTDRLKRAVSREGQGDYAETHYETRTIYYQPDDKSKATPLASEVRCHLLTGRTHQIRVHLAVRKTPLMADATYGAHFSSKARRLGTQSAQALAELGARQALHASELGFRHPLSDELLHFTSPLPKDLLRLEQALQQDSANQPSLI